MSKDIKIEDIFINSAFPTWSSQEKAKCSQAAELHKGSDIIASLHQINKDLPHKNILQINNFITTLNRIQNIKVHLNLAHDSPPQSLPSQELTKIPPVNIKPHDNFKIRAETTDVSGLNEIVDTTLNIIKLRKSKNEQDLDLNQPPDVNSDVELFEFMKISTLNKFASAVYKFTQQMVHESIRIACIRSTNERAFINATHEQIEINIEKDIEVSAEDVQCVLEKLTSVERHVNVQLGLENLTPRELQKYNKNNLVKKKKIVKKKKQIRKKSNTSKNSRRKTTQTDKNILRQPKENFQLDFEENIQPEENIQSEKNIQSEENILQSEKNLQEDEIETDEDFVTQNTDSQFVVQIRKKAKPDFQSKITSFFGGPKKTEIETETKNQTKIRKRKKTTQKTQKTNKRQKTK